MIDKEIIEELEIGIRYYFPTLEGNRYIDKLKEQLALAEKRGESFKGEAKRKAYQQGFKEGQEKALSHIQIFNVAFCNKCKGIFKAVHFKCYGKALKQSQEREK